MTIFLEVRSGSQTGTRIPLNPGELVRIGRTRASDFAFSDDSHMSCDNVDFEVLDDITVNGMLIIPKEGLAFATVTEAQAERRMARGGKLDINIDYVKLVSGEKAALLISRTRSWPNTPR